MLKRRSGTSDDTKLAEVFSQWNSWIFKYMPFEYLVRVMDCFLVEGLTFKFILKNYLYFYFFRS